MKPRISLLLLLALSTGWLFNAVADPKLTSQTETEIRAILDSPQLSSAYVGLSILDLGKVQNASDFPARAPMEKTFPVVFESNAHKKFLPASNMKLFTAAIALHLLGKEKTFPTRVFDLNGELLLYGGGDPSLKVEDIHDLARQVTARGVRKFHSVIGDGSAFYAETANGKYPFGWTHDDARWYYGPEISALAIERNQVDLTIKPGAKSGSPAQVTIDSPLAGVLAVENKATTRLENSSATAKQGNEEPIDYNWRGVPSFIEQPKLRGAQSTLVVSGALAPKQTVRQGVALPSPPRIAAAALGAALQAENPSITMADGSVRYAPLSKLRPSQLVATHQSPPLEILLQRFLKRSDNLYAEMLLRDAAFYHDGEKNGTAPRAHQLLKEWLTSQSIEVSDLRFEDGSGLSRYNLLTPRATAELLVAINRMPQGEAIWNALPIAGVDGTLKNRMGSTPSMGNVRAKTGTFSIASNLSGYVTTRNKQRLAVSLYVNFAPDTKTARWAQDAIFTALANGEIVDQATQ